MAIHLLVETMSKRTYVITCFIAFALAFALRQAADFFFSADPYEGWIGPLTSFGITLITVVLVKADGSRFREHGLSIPKRANRLLTVSLLLAVLYVIVVVFVAGGVSGFEAVPGAPISLDMLFKGASILLAALAAETVFRGYVQTNLESAYGFYTALIVASTLFTLYTLPYSTANGPTDLFRLSLPLFAESAFLCFFFRETKTLLCPIAFATTTTLLQTFTPIEPTAKEYATLISLICYVFLVPIMQAFMDDIKQQNFRLEPVADVEPEEPTEPT